MDQHITDIFDAIEQHIYKVLMDQRFFLGTDIWLVAHRPFYTGRSVLGSIGRSRVSVYKLLQQLQP